MYIYIYIIIFYINVYRDAVFSPKGKYDNFISCDFKHYVFFYKLVFGC